MTDQKKEPVTTVEVRYSDGFWVRWTVSNGTADQVANLIGKPGTLVKIPNGVVRTD